MDRLAATTEACRLRLRPILMTSFAFIMGVVPLVLSSGAGAEMRHAMGVAVFSGMLGVTFFGLLLTPVFYLVIRAFVEKREARKAVFRRPAHEVLHPFPARPDHRRLRGRSGLPRASTGAGAVASGRAWRPRPFALRGSLVAAVRGPDAGRHGRRSAG